MTLVIYFDKKYKSLYPKDEDYLLKQVLTDKSETENRLDDFVDRHGIGPLTDMYSVIHDYYISELSNEILEEKNSNLKHLLTILLEIRGTINNN